MMNGSKQLTLGGLISELEKCPKKFKVNSLIKPHLFRGVNTDLGLEPTNTLSTTVEKMIELLKDCNGKIYKDPYNKNVCINLNTYIWFSKKDQCRYGMDLYPVGVLKYNGKVIIKIDNNLF